MYTWETNEYAEVWRNATSETIEECVEDARQTLDLKSGDMIYVGECEEDVVGNNISLSYVLENIEEDVYEQVGEVSEGWDISTVNEKRREVYEKYDQKLSELIKAYIEEIGETPNFFRIANIRPIIIE